LRRDANFEARIVCHAAQSGADLQNAATHARACTALVVRSLDPHISFASLTVGSVKAPRQRGCALGCFGEGKESM
jgi:hypothetical protein